MAPCGRTADYDMQALWNAEEEVRMLKLRILADLREIAAHIAHAPLFSIFPSPICILPPPENMVSL